MWLWITGQRQSSYRRNISESPLQKVQIKYKYKSPNSKENTSKEAMIRRNISLDREGYKLSYSNENSDTTILFFSMKELKKGIKRGSHTTPGKDGLGYEVFQNLGEVMLDEILCLINTVWGEGRLPEDWKRAVIVPILKPGKESDSPLSYRPNACFM